MGVEGLTRRRPFFLRWYTILGTLVAVLFLAFASIATPLGEVLRAPYRNFYIPSEAMNPTLRKWDRLLARMHRPAELHRGMIILLDLDGSTYIKRIAGLPGDRIEFIEGEVLLNGRKIPRRLVGEEDHDDPMFPRARRFREQFPGEARTHEIYDLGLTVGDDMPELTVPAGHVFVLGDNRDQSADSRFPREDQGVSMLPITDIVGVPQFIYWRAGDGFVNIPINKD